MDFERDPYGKRALDFVEKLRKSTDYEEMCRHIAAEMEWFGFSYVSTWSMPGPGDDPADCLLLNTRPKEYVDRYIEKNYMIRDPVVTELRTTLSPFTWSDLRNRRDLDKTEKAIINEALEFGADDGIVIPIVTPSGSVALFSPCGRQPNLSDRARAALELIGMYSFHSLKRASTALKRADAVHKPLSPREREIMQWVAAGKSDEEIGKILALSTPTVTWHVENAKRKLDAFRRTYAVVQAIRYGEISL